MTALHDDRENLIPIKIARFCIAASLFIITTLCFIFNYEKILYLLISFAAFYDSIYLFYNGYFSQFDCIGLLFFMIAFNTLIFEFYCIFPYKIIQIIIISQLSDALQHFFGINWGYHKIGFISKNKTYEGYMGGYISTVMISAIVYVCFGGFVPKVYQSVSLYDYIINVSIVYLLGIMGGLLSSWFKRWKDIKDYSNLLGPHGGLIDRIDSIILPTVFMFVYNL